MYSNLRRYAFFVAALLAPVLSLTAQQSEQATLLGTVTDTSGAIVSGATVTVINLGTNERRVTTTDSRGAYQVPALNIGKYSVTVEQTGFRQQTVSDIVLAVNQQARIDVQLQVGDTRQEVTVESTTPLLQTDDATQEQLIDTQEIRELPIPLNRNMFELALMSAGMSPGPASSVTTGVYGAGFGIAAMGQKVQNNWILLDGAPLRTAMFGQVRMRPSVEALQEFKVESGFYTADLGNESGAQVISAIRPGTNQFHGTAF